MIQPHGGKLVDRVLTGAIKQDVLERIGSMPVLRLDAESIHNVENIATGVFSPLEGFMGREDFRHVLGHLRLGSDLPWPIPLVLDVERTLARQFRTGKDVLLSDVAGDPAAVLHLEEKYEYDKEETALKVFQTTDAAHPGVARIRAMNDVLFAGKIDLLRESPPPFARYRLSPRETRVLFREKGWRTVAGFQTGNAPHTGHDGVQKIALTFVDGIFINPVIGTGEKGDDKEAVILAAYEELIKNDYLKDRAVLAVLRTEWRSAGPREAVFRAIIHKNFGCTHILIGRDAAGVGNYYHPYAAQDIFEEFPDLGIVPLFFRSLGEN